MAVSDARPMAALQLAAEYVGAVLAITSSADQRDARGRRDVSDHAGAYLRRLAVVRPNSDATSRWHQLQTGDVLCMASLETLDIDCAAKLLLEHESLRHRRQAA